MDDIRDEVDAFLSLSPMSSGVFQFLLQITITLEHWSWMFSEDPIYLLFTVSACSGKISCKSKSITVTMLVIDSSQSTTEKQSIKLNTTDVSYMGWVVVTKNFSKTENRNQSRMKLQLWMVFPITTFKSRMFWLWLRVIIPCRSEPK